LAGVGETRGQLPGFREDLSTLGYPETAIRGILGRDFVGFPGEE
jgi:hypothetical protein